MPVHDQITVGEPRGHYSDAVRAGDLVFVRGTVSSEDGRFVDGDLAEQLRRALRNVERILLAAGSELAHVVKLTIYVTDMDDTAALTPVRAELLGHTRPATTVVEVSRLLDPRMRVEVDAIAALPSPR